MFLRRQYSDELLTCKQNRRKFGNIKKSDDEGPEEGRHVLDNVGHLRRGSGTRHESKAEGSRLIMTISILRHIDDSTTVESSHMFATNTRTEGPMLPKSRTVPEQNELNKDSKAATKKIHIFRRDQRTLVIRNVKVFRTEHTFRSDSYFPNCQSDARPCLNDSKSESFREGKHRRDGAIL